MGVYSTATLPTASVSSRVNSMSEWFDALDGVSSEVDTYTYNSEEYTGAKITLENTLIEVFFGLKTSDDKDTVIYVKNGETFINGPINRTDSGSSSNVILNAYIENGCILLSGRHVGFGGFEIVYTTTTESRNLIGYNSTSIYEANIADISTLTFEDTEDSARIQYTYTNMFPFYAVSGSLDLLSEGYFVNGGVKAFVSDILKECSTVSLLSTASLPRPLNNHLAIGAHCIVPLDDEEVGE